MRHFMTVCEEQGRQAVIVTTHPGDAYEEQFERFTILNRPFPDGRFLHYHWRQLRWVQARLTELEKLGARTVVMTAAQDHWFVTPPFRRRGMRFINSYHCAVRDLSYSRLSSQEIFVRLSSRHHLYYGDPTMAVSPLILRQLDQEFGASKRTSFQFIPDYDRDIFSGFDEHVVGEGPVEIIFAGRVEVNKGVFDLLKMCELLNDTGELVYRFHVHGEGSALTMLREAAARSRHKDLFCIHGFTAGGALAQHYAASHIVVVPTRSDFAEGLAKSVIEGVLALRPVVTSKVCPAIDVVREACVEAEMDDPNSYAQALRSLATRPDYLQEKVQAARKLRENFFQPFQSYSTTLRQSLELAER